MKDYFEDVPVSQRRAVLITFIVVAGAAALGFWKPTVLGTVAVILGFFVMIMLHELGHFLTAKRAGMQVTEFFVGFGPRVWSFTRGETEYGIKAFPLGGYCKITGMTNLEEVPEEDEARTYRAKGFGAKLMVASAGSAMHFVIALVLMFSVLFFAGDLRNAEGTTTVNVVVDGTEREATTGERIAERPGPAYEAGLRPGDTIVSVDGVAVSTWDEMVSEVQQRGGETVPVVVERDGATRTFPVEIEARETTDGGTAGYLGVGQPDVIIPELAFGTAARRTPGEIVDVAAESFQALGKIFSFDGISNYFDNLAGDAPEEREGERFVSPVGFGRLSYQAVSAGWVETFALLISINVFVGIFNLVPLLPFDGGHIAIATYEKVASTIRRRRVQVDVAKLMPITAAVVAVLGFIFLSSLFMDLQNPVENPF
ncbi:MAG TPA: M50 family metallopeptidase [Acidimicrobiia bacterium]|nr:M50 family metallopeptidase [Acidimicrobiia bacterium]